MTNTEAAMIGSLYRRFLYRRLMKLLHRFNLHYAPPNHALTNDGGWPLHWCQWCGMRDFVMERKSLGVMEIIDVRESPVRSDPTMKERDR